MLRQVRLNSSRRATRIKYGVRIPRDYKEAQEFDRLNKNTMWMDATKLEMDQLYEYQTFIPQEKGTRKPPGYTMIRCHLVYDAKQDGRFKARMCAGGHLTGPNTDTYYSSSPPSLAIVDEFFS